MISSEAFCADQFPSVVPLVAPGAMIGEHYIIESCLGIGSTSTVYRCRHLDHRRSSVALKVLNPYLLWDETVVRRFQHEIMATYEVDHVNVIQSYEYLREGSLSAYAMEYIDGGDLSLLLECRKGLDYPEVVDICAQIALGLDAIHRAGIIHRDLRPENIFRSSNGVIKIADFGTARVESRSHTSNGDFIGTIDYVSPEYLAHGELDSRADIYALGLIAYELVSGCTAFPEGSSPIDSVVRRLTADPRPLGDFCPNCPKDLEDIISRALKRNPEERYQTARELYNDLFFNFPAIVRKAAYNEGKASPSLSELGRGRLSSAVHQLAPKIAKSVSRKSMVLQTKFEGRQVKPVLRIMALGAATLLSLALGFVW